MSDHILPWSAGPTRNAWDLASLNKLLRSLIKDGLDVEKYRRTIGNIGLKRDGSGCAVAFWSPSGYGKWYFGLDVPGLRSGPANYFTDHVLLFDADEEGALHKVNRTHPTFSILGLSLQGKIFDYIFTTRESCKINLNTMDDLSALTAPALTNKDFLRAYNCYLNSNIFNLEITSDDRQTGLQDLELLRRVLHGPDFGARGLSFERRSLLAELYVVSFKITIAFTTDNADSLEDVQFNAMKLIEATLILSGDRSITISLCQGGRSKTVSKAFTLRQIRESVLLALPRVEATSKKPCLEMWMNGIGEIVAVKDSKKYVKSTMERDLNRQEGGGGVSGVNTHRTRRGRVMDWENGPMYPVSGLSYEMYGWLREECKVQKKAVRKKKKGKAKKR